MGFLNQYNFQNIYDQSALVNFKKLIKSGNYIYAAGNLEYYISITKTGLAGNVIWTKSYVSPDFGYAGMQICNFILCDNGDLMLLLVVADANQQPSNVCVIIRLNAASGQVIWSKKFQGSYQRVNRYCLNKVGNENYLLMYQLNYTEANTYPATDLLLLNSNGTVIQQAQIQSALTGVSPLGSAHIDNLITSDGSSIFVGTYQGILRLNYNLQVLAKVSFNQALNLHGIYLINGNFYVTGSYTQSGTTRSFYTALPYSSGFTAQTVLLQSMSNGGYPIFLNQGFVYVTFDENVRVQKYNLGGNIKIWSRDLNITDDDLVLAPQSNNDVLVAGDNILGVLNTDLNSCQTLPDNKGSVLEEYGISSITNYNITTSNNVSYTIFTCSVYEEIHPTQKVPLCGVGVDYSMLQSPHLYFQSAGSTGNDSTAGIHLRWLLKRALANHLPKGDYATTTANFNKPDDYVRIHRALYTPVTVGLNFNTPPDEFSDTSRTWKYAVDSYLFYVYFRTASLYNIVRSTVDPATDPLIFIEQYCNQNGIFEVENKNYLSFGISATFSNQETGSLFTELLSVEENKITAPKRVSFREKVSSGNFNVRSENIRSVRFYPDGVHPLTMSFEFYHMFVDTANDNDAWEFVGDFALTTEATVAQQRLKPELIDGVWRRYNDGAYVKASNYMDKWYGTDIESEDSIAMGVQKYIDLSNDADNPLATEIYNYDEVPSDEDNNTEASSFEISNLALLQLASLDFHVARMLGLGTLDLISQDTYVYMASYTTYADLQDGLGAREVQHTYCTLPTSVNDQRLPVPVDLKAPVPGIFMSNEIEAPATITNAEGYTLDGKSRYLTLYSEDLIDEPENAPFNIDGPRFISSKITAPVYAGIEYKKMEVANWLKPELSYNAVFKNIDATAANDFERSETRSIVIPESGYPLFIHREKQSGWHTYSSYGINWFSRAASSEITHNIETVIVPENLLLPPSALNAVLVQPEGPLMLTSASEQQKLAAIAQGIDKTLVRLTFDYNHAQELISYQQKIGGEYINGYSELPDNEELFAEKLEILYRNSIPGSVSGKVGSIEIMSDPSRVRVYTESYVLNSTQPDPYDEESEPQTLVPQIPTGLEANYVGAVLVCGGKEFIVESVDVSNQYPVFTVLKQVATIVNDDESTTENPQDLISPEVGGLFLLVENMQNTFAWDTSYNTNPLPLKVSIDFTQVHREEVDWVNSDEITETYVQKFRGIYQEAVITKVYEDFAVEQGEYQEPIIESRHLGLYKFTFPGYALAQHSQFSANGNSVEYANGVVRVKILSDPDGKRKELKVSHLKLQDEDGNLTFFAVDGTFPSDADELAAYTDKLMADNEENVTQIVNYYPGYKVYLYADAAHGLTEPYTLPSEDEDSRYSIFGIRAFDQMYNYRSLVSVPALMLARKIEPPQKPRTPSGGPYATRPDYYGKSTYTFTTEFERKPYSVQFARTNDIMIINTLYSTEYQELYGMSTVDHIFVEIFKGGEEPFYVDRWNNLLGFNYTYNDNPSDNGLFEMFDNHRLPLPDSLRFIESINNFIDEHNAYYGQNVEQIATVLSLDQIIIPEVVSLHGELRVVDFVKEVVYNCFTPLTEIPVIYKHIRDNSYVPQPKKQVIRDRSGNLLDPLDPDFDMAPMMKVITTNPLPKTQFTDFGLDGSSLAKYFYISREISLQMETGPYSDILGPISLVDTKAPLAPGLVRVLSRLENPVLGVTPGIQFEINAYQEVQHIKKIQIYRTLDGNSSVSIRTMDIVKEIDIETEGIAENSTWTFTDDFSDLADVPYGDMLYYRIVALRQIKYADSTNAIVIDYVPSEPTGVIMTNVVNNQLPESPVFSYYSEPLNAGVLQSVTLNWQKTVHNGKYHLYKMNSQGNWTKITTVISNREDIYLPIDSLTITDANENPMYHHFKMIAENFSGMFSTKENILTIYSPDNWQDIGGISDMIIEGTFIVR